MKTLMLMLLTCLSWSAIDLDMNRRMLEQGKWAAVAELTKRSPTTDVEAQVLLGEAMLLGNDHRQARLAFDRARAAGEIDLDQRIADRLPVLLDIALVNQLEINAIFLRIEDEVLLERQYRHVLAELSLRRPVPVDQIVDVSEHVTRHGIPEPQVKEVVAMIGRDIAIHAENQHEVLAAVEIAKYLMSFSKDAAEIKEILVSRGLDSIFKSRRTMADMRTIGTAIEQYAVDNNVYPTASSIGELERFVMPTYVRRISKTDGWDRAYVLDSTAMSYVLLSGGADGDLDTSYRLEGTQFKIDLSEREHPAFERDLVYTNGEFVQWPESHQW